jgi:hypothetical protein
VAVVAFLLAFERVLVAVVLEVIFDADYIGNFEESVVFSVFVVIVDNHMVVAFAV